MQINYNNVILNKPIFQSCEETNGSFQPWHTRNFSDFATLGAELIFPYEDITVTRDNCPFKKLSEKYYQIDFDIDFSVSVDCELFVMPHHRYYLEDNFPLVLPYLWGYWYPGKLSVTFRFTEKTIFKKNNPFAQVFPVSKNIEISKMSQSQVNRMESAREYLVKNNLISRKWKTNTGVELDNLYNVLAHLNDINKLPFGKRSKYAKVSENKEENN